MYHGLTGSQALINKGGLLRRDIISCEIKFHHHAATNTLWAYSMTLARIDGQALKGRRKSRFIKSGYGIVVLAQQRAPVKIGPSAAVIRCLVLLNPLALELSDATLLCQLWRHP